MHGVKRVKPTSEQEAQRKKRKEAVVIAKYGQLVDQYRQWRRDGKNDSEALELVSKALQMNPESYTAWNYRREVVAELCKNLSTDEQARLFDRELGFTMERLQAFPKVYWIWNYRKWCLEKNPKSNWSDELKLVTKLLALDARNYHGWHYRRLVVAELQKQSGKSLTTSELDYTKAKITDNFSNFSAWHNRSKLLVVYLEELAPSFGSQLDRRAHCQQLWLEELDFVRQAFYTDPEDQSAWLYHHWLLCGHEDIIPGVTLEFLIEKVESELESIQTLYAEEQDNKWCMLSLVEYYTLHQNLASVSHVAEIKDLLTRLVASDAMRSKRYEYMISQL